MAPLVMGSIPIILPEIKYAVVAQLVEHMSEEHGVGGSIHSRRTKWSSGRGGLCDGLNTV